MIISGNECGDNTRGYWVYYGFIRNTIVYVGTTMQHPSDRFRWHKHNGKNLRFEVVAKFDTAEEMLDAEVKLINEKQPRLNKKTKKHNDNRKLTQEELDKRKGDSCWCQSCLKRKVNSGYTFCYFCS